MSAGETASWKDNITTNKIRTNIILYDGGLLQRKGGVSYDEWNESMQNVLTLGSISYTNLKPFYNIRIDHTVIIPKKH